MGKYIVICNDHVIIRGDREHYTPIEDRVPIGYRYIWAFSSPELLTINVMPIIERLPKAAVTEKPQEVVGMFDWAKETINHYRMVM